MLLYATIAAVHYLTLALGLGSVFARGRRLRDLERAPDDARARTALFQADALWGIAALLWLVTGGARAFGHLEKDPEFYLRNGFFFVKMGLFASVVALEIFPMITFIRWRRARARGVSIAHAPWRTLIRLNDAEVALVVVIPFVAALMARGAWLF